MNKTSIIKVYLQIKKIHYLWSKNKINVGRPQIVQIGVKNYTGIMLFIHFIGQSEWVTFWWLFSMENPEERLVTMCDDLEEYVLLEYFNVFIVMNHVSSLELQSHFLRLSRYCVVSSSQQKTYQIIAYTFISL